MTLQDTIAPRQGRRFEPTHELSLHEAAVAACEALPGSHRGVLIVREMVGPIGIPDLTALVGDTSNVTKRLQLGVPPILNQVDAGIVASLSDNRPRSAETVSATLGWPIETIGRRLPHLMKSGAISGKGVDGFVRPTALCPVGRLYAIEAKMNDRVSAIQQARSYASWADNYVLVMGELGARPLHQLMDDVDHDRGGLVVNGRWMRRPVIAPHSPARRLWASEHLIAALSPSVHQPSVRP
jgi:hypothetical protein